MSNLIGPQTPARKTKHTTLRCVAEATGLSLTTVADVLKGNVRYTDETRDRVLASARALNYRPNRSAQAIKRGRSNLIGVMHSGGTLQVASERAKSLGRLIANTEYELLLADTLWYPNEANAIIDHILASQVEGFIFSGPSFVEAFEQTPFFQRLAETGLPMVVISAEPILGVPTINSDFEGGFAALTQHLVSVGRKRLTLLLGCHPDESWHGLRRMRGFVSAVQANGGTVLPPRPIGEYCTAWSGAELQGEILYYSGPVSQLSSPLTLPLEAMDVLLNKGYQGDAILASNDEWALGVISTCLRRGIDVPGEIAVVGYDNSDLALVSPVRITSASQQSEETCRLAVNMLLSQMKDGAPAATAVHETLVPCPVMIRESSGGGINSLRHRSR